MEAAVVPLTQPVHNERLIVSATRVMRLHLGIATDFTGLRGEGADRHGAGDESVGVR